MSIRWTVASASRQYFMQATFGWEEERELEEVCLCLKNKTLGAFDT